MADLGQKHFILAQNRRRKGANWDESRETRVGHRHPGRKQDGGFWEDGSRGRSPHRHPLGYGVNLVAFWWCFRTFGLNQQETKVTKGVSDGGKHMFEGRWWFGAVLVWFSEPWTESTESTEWTESPDGADGAPAFWTQAGWGAPGRRLARTLAPPSPSGIWCSSGGVLVVVSDFWTKSTEGNQGNEGGDTEPQREGTGIGNLAGARHRNVRNWLMGTDRKWKVDFRNTPTPSHTPLPRLGHGRTKIKEAP
jgi:hypothetical protein